VAGMKEVYWVLGLDPAFEEALVKQRRARV
jgi:hypothetical protein